MCGHRKPIVIDDDDDADACARAIGSDIAAANRCNRRSIVPNTLHHTDATRAIGLESIASHQSTASRRVVRNRSANALPNERHRRVPAALARVRIKPAARVRVRCSDRVRYPDRRQLRRISAHAHDTPERDCILVHPHLHRVDNCTTCGPMCKCYMCIGLL